jgi:hypothetical protein
MITRLKRHHKTYHNSHDPRNVSLLGIWSFHSSIIRRRWNAILLLLVLHALAVYISKSSSVTDAAADSSSNQNKHYHHGTPDDARIPRRSAKSSILPPPPPPPPPIPSQQHDPFTSVDDFNNNDPYWSDETQSSLYSNNNNNGDDMNLSSEFDHPFNNDVNNNYYPQRRQQGRPPFQPISSKTQVSSSIDLKKETSASMLPSIHYSFPQRNVPVESLDGTATSTNNKNKPKNTSTAPQNQMPKFASARQDVVTRYIMESYWNRCSITLGSAMVGCLVTAFLGQSLLGHVPSVSIIIATSILFSILTWLRNNIYGELIRAISLTIIFSFQRSIQIRNQYPAHQYLYNAIIGDTTTNVKRRRQPFPPTNNPWTWSSNNEDDDIEFQMIPTVIAMAFIGSVIGTNLPILPSSFGALLGAATFAYTTTLSSSRGDLCRCMGMRIVALVREFITIANTDLHLPNKSAVVASAILDKLLILDRQHSIRQRIGSAISALIDTISRIQRDMQQQPAASSNTDNIRTNGINSRRRPAYDDGDKDTNADDIRSKYDESLSQPKTYSDDRRNVTNKKTTTQRAPETTKPRETTSSGWFSIFPSRSNAKTNNAPIKSRMTTDKDVDESFPYDDETDSGWKDDSNNF